jgi:Icc-related predicted phosphoesterase
MVPNLLYLPDGHVVDIDGVKFGGLGGNFSYKTFNTWGYWHEHRTLRSKRHGGEQRRLNHFTRDRWELLMRSQMDVLITHDAPSEIGVVGRASMKDKLPEDEMTDKIYGRCGCPCITELIEQVEPKHFYCGHWHQFRKASLGRRRDIPCTVLNLTGNPPTEDCMEVVEIYPSPR